MIIEILLCILVSCVIWFFVFQIRLMCDNKKILKDIANKIEKQNKKFFIDGKEFDIKKELFSQSPKVPKVPEPTLTTKRKSIIKKSPNLLSRMMGSLKNLNLDLK